MLRKKKKGKTKIENWTIGFSNTSLTSNSRKTQMLRSTKMCYTMYRGMQKNVFSRQLNKKASFFMFEGVVMNIFYLVIKMLKISCVFI